MSFPADDTIEKLLAVVRQQPDDNTARGVFADRLRELGEDELADWWAGGAEKWMRAFAAKCVYEFDDPGQGVTGQPMTYEEVMGGAEQWITDIEEAGGEVNIWSLGCRFSPFQLTAASELLENPETAKTFWRAYETIRGVLVPEVCKQHGGSLFNCLC